MTDLAPIFLKAADVIRTNGHHKGGFHEARTDYMPLAARRVCAAAALSIAVSGGPVPDETDDMDCTLQDVLSLLSGQIYSQIVNDDPIERIADWNDMPERTPAEVIAAFETAAHMAAAVQAVA